MSRNRKIGIQGEEIANHFLKSNGYEIIETNWTTGHKEIDIITFKNETFIFVEVKTRSTLKHGMPEESISLRKIESVTEAARIYLYDKKYKDIRFDVVSVYLKKNNTHEILHIKDAFY
jgi:putative endonuclease